MTLVIGEVESTSALPARRGRLANREWLILWASPDSQWSAPIGTSSSTAYPRGAERFIFGGTGTSTMGCVLVPRDSDQFRLRALHDRSGLTWEEIADLVGVKRRSVHFWAKGHPVNATNARHLSELWQLVAGIDGGDPSATRRALLAPDEHGNSPAHAFGVHIKREREHTTVRSPWRGGEYRPPAFKPAELLGNLHDAVSTSPGKSRRSIRIPRRSQR